jgi:threonine synthase
MSGLIEKYAAYLPVTEKTPRLSLGEGSTPLIYAEKISEELNCQFYLKYEGLNPTGSFKDRGMVMAVAKAKEEGAEAIICASTGNTSASAAAYAARAGLKCYVVIPDGYVAMGKLAQAIMYGAEIIPIKGNFDQALQLVKKLSENHPIQLVNSINPYRIEGQKTGAFEVIEQLGKAPDIFALPVGNAGNITAYWKGFNEAFEHKLSTSKPVMWGFEAEGAAAIVKDQVIENPDTFATAIRIGNPASWKQAVAARDESGGMIDLVTDEEIRSAYYDLAHKEGVFCEPASAASVAGLIKQAKQGKIPAGSTIVAILTGNGLKDPTSAMEKIEQSAAVAGTEEELMKRIFTVGGI